MINKPRQAPKPAHMSQLDYLWTYFGSYSVAEEASDTPREDVILTEKALVDYVKSATNGIFSLELRDKVGTTDKLELVGKSYGGGEISVIELDKENHLISISKLIATQVEVDNRVANAIGDYLLVFTMLDGSNIYVNLSDFQYKGQETKSANVSIVGDKVAVQVKLDNPIIEPTVNLTEGNNGLQANLVLAASNSGVQFIKTSEGIKASFVWNDTTQEVKAQFLTLDQYLLLTPVEGTMYFITDNGYIYFNGVKYGEKCNITPEELEQLKADVTKLRTDVDYKHTRALEAEANINKELATKVAWDESKTKITLPSGGQLTGIKYGSDPADLENGATIAQLSKYNKMDFGSPKFPLNLNTPDGVRPTVQEASQTGEEAHQIAYLSDLEGISGGIEVIKIIALNPTWMFTYYIDVEENNKVINCMENGIPFIFQMWVGINDNPYSYISKYFFPTRWDVLNDKYIVNYNDIGLYESGDSRKNSVKLNLNLTFEKGKTERYNIGSSTNALIDLRYGGEGNKYLADNGQYTNVSTNDYTNEDKAKVATIDTLTSDLTSLTARVEALESATPTTMSSNVNEIEELQTAVSDIQVRLAKIETALSKVL